MDRVVKTSPGVDAWMPLETTLSRENLILENLSRVAPLLQAETSTSRVLLV